MKNDISIILIPRWTGTANSLNEHEIFGVFQLLSMSDEELLSLKGFGKQRLKDVHEMILDHIIPMIQEIENGTITIDELNKYAEQLLKEVKIYE